MFQHSKVYHHYHLDQHKFITKAILIEKTRKTGKSTLNNSIIKAPSLKINLSLPTGYVGQLSTPTKDVKMVAIITLNISLNDKMKVDNTVAPMEVDPQQIFKNNHSNPQHAPTHQQSRKNFY